MTVEVDWEVPPLPALPTTPRPPTSTPIAEVSLSEGRVVEAQAGPGMTAQSRPNGTWLLGSGGKGRSRVRLEAPLGSDLVLKVAGQTFRVPLASILEGPQRTPPRSGVEIGVAPAEPGGDGTVEPGSSIPLSVAFNVLTPEVAEVNLQCSAELRPIRGGDAVWRAEWQEVVRTDALEPAKHPLVVAARGGEGTYVLEVKTSWEPLGDPAGFRLGRWVRRRRNPSQTTSATRRLTLAIVGPQPLATPTPTKVEGPPSVGVEVDAIDPARSRGHRPTASGRSPVDAPGRVAWTVPEVALVDPSNLGRLRGWINRTLTDVPTSTSNLGPADPTGLAWSAVGLRVVHPERPHRLSLTVSGGHPGALGVAMVAGGATGKGRVVLDACASGPPILEGGPPSTYSWPVWPDSEAPVLVLVNRSGSAPVQVGPIILTELPELPPSAAPLLSERSMGLHLAGLRSLDRFGGGDDSGRVDPLAQARNLSTYLAHCGTSTVVLPEGMGDRSRRVGLQGQADEDSTGPDRLDLMLKVLARRGVSAWVDVAFEGAMPGLPSPDSPEAWGEGLVRLDRRGLLDGPGSYQPIHPRVREAMARKVAETVAPRKARANLSGILVRLGPGSTLPGGPDSGLDDATFARFVAASFEPGSATRVPGQGSSDPARFERRAGYVEGIGRVPWLAWRAREVASIYEGLAQAARKSATGAILAVVNPGLEPGPAGDEARRVDLAGLGPAHAWRGVGFDLSEWPTGESAPVVFRGAGLSTDDLGHDLATSPELDGQVAARASRGAVLGVEGVDRDPNPLRASAPKLTASPMADGPAGDEPLGHALAALDPRRILIAATGVAGQEERLRRFARVFGSLPIASGGPMAPRPDSGVVARPVVSGSDTYLAMANDTPYPILLEAVLQAPPGASVMDLGRGKLLDPERSGGQIRLVLDMPPHGVSAIQVGSSEVAVASTTPHPGPAVLDGMKAQYEDLNSALKRLDRLPKGDSTPALGESERINVRRDLTAALSAYRERRYADFARLGGSHWARHASGGPAAAVAGDRSGVIRTGDASSALPPGRRLR